jgi:hypothetical protein
MDEALETFIRGNTVASMVMMGVAAERAFNLLADSVVSRLHDPNETQTLENLLSRFQMKPKVDWIHEKFRKVQATKPKAPGFPDNATLMVTAIYDMIRCQRNDLGHPRDLPPVMSREDAYANLLIFPRFYESSERVRAVLAQTTI